MKKYSVLILFTALWTSMLAASPIGPQTSKESRFKLPAATVEAPVLQAEESDVPAYRTIAVGKLPSTIASAATAATKVKEGNYVLTYTTLSSQLDTSGGCGVEIAAVEGKTDTYVIKNFYEKGASIEFTVDAAAGTFSVPNQKLSQVEEGQIDIAFCTSTGAPDYTTPLSGVINADGSLVITSWWGMFLHGGKYADTPLGWYSQATMTPANATMTETPADGSEPYTYGVVVTQQNNVLTVLNFANHGYPVEIVVNDDHTGQISQQVVYVHVEQGNVYVAGYTESEIAGQINLIRPIELNKSQDLRTLSWNKWTIYSQGGYFNLWSGGVIKTDFDIDYPVEVTSLDGDGTEASPYLIRTVGDLSFVGRQCTAGATAGKYYALANNINMANYRFVPIGTPEHPFEGVLDGRNYTLSYLTIEGITSGYTGLVGYASEKSILRNIKLNQPKVSSKSRYTAALAGYSEGTISNCHISEGIIGSDYSSTVGMAGHVANIDNCSAYLTQVIGLGGKVAGLVGELTGNMTNCKAYDMIVYAGSTNSSRAPSGGLVAMASEGSSITDSHFSGLLSGRPSYSIGQTIGGIVGEGYRTTLARCFVAAEIQGYTNEALTGGLSGHFLGSISDCFAYGRVIGSASENTGGLVGYLDPVEESTISNCYSSASVIGLIDSYDVNNDCRELVGNYAKAKGTYDNVWFDSNMTSAFGTLKNAKTTAELTSGAAIDGFNTDTWLFSPKSYPRLKAQSTVSAAYLAGSNLEFLPGDNLSKISGNTIVNTVGSTIPAFIVNGSYTATGHGASISQISNNSFRLNLNGSFATDTLVFVNGNVQYIMYTVKFAPKVFDGDGTKESPYLIKTKEDMIKLAEITSIDNQPYNSTYFLMTNDIDMEGVENFQGIGNVPYSRTVSFGGIFDGGGHAIHNLKLGTISWDKSWNGTILKPADETVSWADGKQTTDNQPSFTALFGTINNMGQVLNLTIADDCMIDGGNYTAGIAISNGGTIANCRNHARIRSIQNYTAGIVVSNVGTVYQCLNTGDVMSNGSYAAGIAVYNYGTIDAVMNTGNITCAKLSQLAYDEIYKYAGGIVSYASGTAITNAVNAGTITTQLGECGGIVGYNPSYGNGRDYNALQNIINYGMVNGATLVYNGSIAGGGNTGGTVAKVHWDNQILPITPEGNTTHTGMTGLSTATLTSGEPIEGFDTDIWTFEKGVYPVIKAFADVPQVKVAAHTIVTFAEGQNVKNVLSDATLAQADGLAWSLKNSTTFSIDGNTLKAPATVEVYDTDVLTATYGKYVKQINLACSPKIALQGSGTEADPYQLASVDDWNTLYDFIRTTGSDLDGQYLKVMNDIDFGGHEFKPVAIGGNTLNAHLLGDGKSLLNIGHSFALATDRDGNTIRNSAGKQGAIGKLGPNGQISDLTITGNFSQTADTRAGVFVGELYGSVINCVNKATLTGTKGYRGGIAAVAYEGAQFIDCVNRGTVTASGNSAGYAGGIVAETTGHVTFIRCGNEGTVNGTSTYCGGIAGTTTPGTFIECYNTADQTNDVSYYGGLIGNATSKTSLSGVNYVFDRCYNTGNLTSKGNTAGLVANGNTNSAFIATGCYNTGNISTGTVGNAAGLFGGTGPRSKITDCYNTGDVTVTQAKSNAGGIVKSSGSGTADDPLVISNCYNKGKITADASIAGGIVAQPGGNVIIDHCENLGDIVAGTCQAGGIFGNTFSNVTITNCRNLGNVTVGTNRAGGILGDSQTGVIVITDCVNFGNVTSTNTLKGTTDLTSGSNVATGHAIGGIAGHSGASIDRCYNVGEVKGTNQVGGIVGQPYAGTTATQGKLAISNTYNIGSVTALDNECGAIVGINAETNDANTAAKYWSDEVVIDNVHYLDNVCSSSLVPAGSTISNNDLATLDLGEGWTSADDYSFPVLEAHLDHDLTHFHAATLVLAAGDSHQAVTQPFKVGRPDGVVWTASREGISIDGNNVLLPDGVHNGKLTMTASLGEYSKSYDLMLDSVTSIDELYADGDVVSIQYFDINGLSIANENVEPGKPYIVITTYADGTVRASKIVR